MDGVTLEVGKVIQQGRQSKGLTQKDLATVSVVGPILPGCRRAGVAAQLGDSCLLWDSLGKPHQISRNFLLSVHRPQILCGHTQEGPWPRCCPGRGAWGDSLGCVLVLWRLPELPSTKYVPLENQRKAAGHRGL